MLCVFFFNDPATTEIYPLSLPDALPISRDGGYTVGVLVQCNYGRRRPLRIAGVPVGQEITDLTPCREPCRGGGPRSGLRSEEHTPELQSPCNLVCRLLLEKKRLTHEHTY